MVNPALEEGLLHRIRSLNMSIRATGYCHGMFCFLPPDVPILMSSCSSAANLHKNLNMHKRHHSPERLCRPQYRPSNRRSTDPEIRQAPPPNAPTGGSRTRRSSPARAGRPKSTRFPPPMAKMRHPLPSQSSPVRRWPFAAGAILGCYRDSAAGGTSTGPDRSSASRRGRTPSKPPDRGRTPSLGVWRV